jgi:two-component system, sensor histidine kinase and response regulator
MAGAAPRPGRAGLSVPAERSIGRLTWRFAALTALVALALLVFRWHSAQAQVNLMHTQLAAGLQAQVRHALRAGATSSESQAWIDALRQDDPRLLSLRVLGADGRVEVAGGAAAELPAPDPQAGLRSLGGSWVVPSPRAVLDHALPGGRVLRVVVDTQPLVQAWNTLMWPALVMLVAMAVVIVLLFRWLLATPLASLREMTDFATALPQARVQRLPERDSHLGELDRARAAFNQAAALLESQRRELDQQRALLRAVIDAIPGGLALKTLDGTLLLMNAYSAGRLGRAPQELEGHSSASLGRPEFDARMRALDARLVAHRGSESVVTAVDSYDDATPHFITKTLVHLPGSGDPLVLTTSTNIAELKRSQRAVEQAQSLLRAVFDADDAQMFLKDAAGRFVMVNASLLRYWGFEESQVLGRDSIQLFGDLPGVRTSMEQDRIVWAGGGPLVTEQRLAGKTGDAEFVISRRLVDAIDGQRLLLAVARDVTAFRAQARALEHQQYLIREVIDLEEQFVLVKDAQLRYLVVNAAYLRATGLTEHRMVGRTIEEVFPGRIEDAGPIHEADRRVLAEGIEIRQIEQADLGAGPRRFFAIRRPIRLADCSTGVLALIRDVTEDSAREASLHQAMQRAQAAVDARSRFLANISHEIRTPINGVMGLTDLVLGSTLTTQQREWLGLARLSAENLLAIVNEILDLSKIDAGAMTIESTRFDLHALLVQACRPLALRATAKELRFALAIEPVLPEQIDGDPTRLRQVLNNLVGNAVKFTEAGQVTVRAGVAEGRIVVAVEDTGPGIGADKLQQVFEPFIQADDSTTRRFGGTGLGLAISRQLVQLMGGRLQLDSTPGRGSRFTFDLPLAAGARALVLPPLTGRRLVWINTGSASATLWRGWIEGWGAQLDVATSPSEALALGDEPVDTVVIEGPCNATAIDFALREWRARGRLERVLAIDALGGSPTLGDTHASEGARGLRWTRLAQPFSPRVLHATLCAASVSARSGNAAPFEAQRMRGRLAGQRVLLAEDNEVNCLLAEAVLTQLGAAAVVARDGVQAFDALFTQPFDVVLMDIQMPELDGLEVVRRWREREGERGAARLPVIAMTAHAMAGDRERFIAAGFDGYIGKPFTQKGLVEEVQRVREAVGRAPA